MRMIVALFAFVTMPVVAQELIPVGELLDKGARQLNKEDVVALLSGATMSGIQRAMPDWRFSLKYDANRSVSGSAWGWTSKGQQRVTVSGTWMVNEQGQLCRDMRNSNGNRPTGTEQCAYYFKLGETYWESPSDDRSERAILREMTK